MSVKCKEASALFHKCDNCDITKKPNCDKCFDFDLPKPVTSVTRRDHIQVSWNECPTCGKSVGYHPKIKDFRCPRCSQRIEF